MRGRGRSASGRGSIRWTGGSTPIGCRTGAIARHAEPWPGLPEGAFVLVEEVPALVLTDRLVPWSEAGYGAPRDRPIRGTATALTPAATVEVLRHGYRPVIHPSAAATER